MMSLIRGRLRFLASLGGATGITLASIWLLALLNARALPDLPSRTELRTVMIQGPEVESDSREPQPEPEPQPPEEEVMTVDLDLPTPDVPEPEPLDLSMSLPSPILAQVRDHADGGPRAGRATQIDGDPVGRLVV